MIEKQIYTLTFISSHMVHKGATKMYGIFVTLFFSLQEDNQDGSPSNGCGAKQLSVQSFFQWVSGQAHVPLTDAKRDSYRITVNFDHDCTSRYGPQTLCFPIVNA
ncbi:hypothetical protein ATANTOWER_023985 [Ataeniobius toweri]|uniref:Uncharacterized protein n=1 Tax=Ataeniobius toweri TaxID=208326 RepID=A0ABU7BIC5_9TELE|nr:hypothetical protein [Ataeniobius toweri]